MTILPDINDYFDTPEDRLVTKFLKLDRFLLSIFLAPWPSSDSERREAAKTAYDHIYQALVSVGLRKGNIKLEVPLSGSTADKDAVVTSDPWMTIVYDEPGNEFAIAFGDSHVSISCVDAHLESVVRLVSNVFPSIVTTILADDLNTALKVRLRASGVHYSFKNRFRLGNDIAQKIPVTNCDLVAQALMGLSETPKKDKKWAPRLAYHALGREDFVRLDFNYHATRKYSDMIYNVKLNVEAPFNEGNRLLYVSSILSMEEEFGFDVEKVLDLRTPLVDFYRDTILGQFLAHLLVNTHFTT